MLSNPAYRTPLQWCYYFTADPLYRRDAVHQTRADHLEENVEALVVELSADKIARLEETISPQWPVEGKD